MPKFAVYGILKRGFQLDLEKEGCKFLGEATINGAVLHRIGGGVGLRFVVDPTKIIHCELFDVPDKMIPWLDGIENNGHTYNRKVVETRLKPLEVGEVVDAWVYEHIYWDGHDYSFIPIFERGVYK